MYIYNAVALNIFCDYFNNSTKSIEKAYF